MQLQLKVGSKTNSTEKNHYKNRFFCWNNSKGNSGRLKRRNLFLISQSIEEGLNKDGAKAHEATTNWTNTFLDTFFLLWGKITSWLLWLLETENMFLLIFGSFGPPFFVHLLVAALARQPGNCCPYLAHSCRHSSIFEKISLYVLVLPGIINMW